MKTIIPMLSIFFLHAVQMLWSQAHTPNTLEVVSTVDLSRYVGTWYEIARLPNRFQNKCAGDVTATYFLLEDGEIRVINRCRTFDGETTQAEGRARRASEDEPNTKLKVRFAPAFLSFLPFVWGNYWIIDLARSVKFSKSLNPELLTFDQWLARNKSRIPIG